MSHNRREFETWFKSLNTDYVVSWREDKLIYSSQYLQLAWMAWKEAKARGYRVGMEDAR